MNRQRVSYGTQPDNSTGDNSTVANTTFEGKFCWLFPNQTWTNRTVENIGDEVYEKVTVGNLVVKNQSIGVIPSVSSKVPVGYFSFYYL